jgi:Fic family protein
MYSNQTWIWQQPNWPKFVWDADELSNPLAQARLAQGKLHGVAHILNADLSSEALTSILIQDGITTSAIEGERLHLDAVRSSVANQLGLPNVGLPKPDRAIDGLVEVLLDATQKHNQPLTLQRLCNWHGALFPTGYSGLREIRVGQMRGAEPMRVVSGRIGHETVHFEAPPYEQIDTEMSRFIDWFNSDDSQTLDGLIRAGVAHLWFITIHPFEDGNGRIARAITDMALAQDERLTMRLFSLSAQILAVREAYYNILESTQKGEMDITAWLKWFLTQIQNAVELAQLTVANTLNKAKFWMTHQTKPLNERQRKVLNRMLDAKDGFEGGMNTRKYMSLTKTSRATAYRELAQMVEWGCLQANEKGGRSSGYLILMDPLPMIPENNGSKP